MKTTIYFILIASMLFLGCSKSDDDLNSDLNNNLLKPELNSKVSPITGNGTVSHQTSGGYYTPLICDGVEIDYLEGNLNFHCVMHYENGVIIWMTHTYTGYLTSANTGEVFQIKETDKINNVQTNFTWHANIKGNKGNNYIISGSGLNVAPWTISIDKAICPGKAN